MVMEIAINRKKIIFLESIIFFLVLSSRVITTPLPFCLILVLLSGVVATMRGLSVSKWIFCTIFLIFLGGIMVMFLYVCSLAINEKLIFIKGLTTMFFLGLIIFNRFGFKLTKLNNSLWELYQYRWSPIIGFFIFYLLIALMLSVKFSQSFKGALSKTW